MASIVETYARINLLAHRLSMYADDLNYSPELTLHEKLEEDYPELAAISLGGLNESYNKFMDEWFNSSPAEVGYLSCSSYIAVKLFEKYLPSSILA